MMSLPSKQIGALQTMRTIASSVAMLALLLGCGNSGIAVKVAELPEADGESLPVGLDFGVDGSRVVVVSQSGQVRIWDWRSNRIEKTLENPQGFGNGLASNPILYSPDGRLLASCDGGSAGELRVRIWSTSTWSVAKDLVDNGSGLCSGMVFTPDSQVLIRTADTGGRRLNTLIAYSVDTWQAVWGLSIEGLSPVSVAISPTGELAAISGTTIVSPPGVTDPLQASQQSRVVGNLDIVDLGQHKVVRVIPSVSTGPVAWNRDGVQVAVVGGPDVEVYDARSGQNLIQENIEKSGSMNVRFTADGRYLVASGRRSGSSGIGVMIWDSQNHALLQHLSVGAVGSIAVSRNGKYLAVGTSGRTTIWQLK